MPKTTLVSEDDFRQAAKDGNALTDASLRKGFIAEIKVAGDAAERSLDFVISTDTVDRMGDTVAVDGWKLDNFRKNPVVLFAHDSSVMPVAKASDIRIEDGKLKARAEFMPKDISGFADAVFRAVKGGFLNATSVGFAPIKYNFVDDPQRRFGIDFIEQELLEFSIVPVPANPEALVAGKSAEFSPIIEWAEAALEKSGTAAAFAERILKAQGMAIMPIDRVERIERAAKAQRLAKARGRELDLIRARG